MASSSHTQSTFPKQSEEHHLNRPTNKNLNIDLCFELIFPYLDLKDLVNVADTNKQMKDAAETTFCRKYGRNLFVFYTKTQHVLQSTARVTYLDVRDSKMCFGVLRCFGHLITKLMLDYYFSFPLFCSRLDFYVNKYSIDYVTELEIYGYESALESLQEPILNVEKIRLILCDLDEPSTRLNYLFPNLRSLEFARDFLVSTKIDDQYCIASNYPHLEHLSVHVTNDSEIPGFREEIILAALKANPQIRSLCLYSLDYDLPIDFFHKISESCECLETLEINGNLSEFDDVVHFKSVKTFSIFPIGCHLKSMPFTFDDLEIFNWKVPSLIEEFIFSFIQNNPTIRKISFCNSFNSPVMIESVESIKFVRETVFRNAALNAENLWS